MLSEIGVLYRREMRAALRERAVVVNGILVPIFLYPLMLWLMFTAILFVKGKTEGMTARIALAGDYAAHPALAREFERAERVELAAKGLPVAETRPGVGRGDIDALVELLPPADGAAAEGNFRIRVTYDKSKPRSEQARDRVTEVVAAHRAKWLDARAKALGVPDVEWEQFADHAADVATKREIGAFILSLMVPLFMILMTAVGCFHPAVDATAGERERGTFETTLTLGASRVAIVTGKFLAVATLGTIAGLLNLAAMSVSMKSVIAPLARRSGESLEFGLPPMAIPLLVVGTVLLALFLAAGMMVLAAFAKTFKEGQTMVTPLYMATILPTMFLQVPGLKFSVQLALIPIVNVTMMFREAITGTFNLPLIALTLAVEAVMVVVAVRLAAWVLGHEEFVTGAHGGSLTKFVKARRAAARGGERR